MVSLAIGSRTDTGKLRSNNQDFCSTFNTPLGMLFVVCDGMGGHKGGEIASKMAVEEIGSIMRSAKSSVQASVVLKKAIEKANESVYCNNLSYDALRGMGTTGVLLLLDDVNHSYHLAHVGDSRIYRISGGKIQQMTKDHSYVQMLVDSGHISPEEAKKHPNKNQITHYIGEGPNMECVVRGPLRLQGNEIFILCTDGLSDLVDADEFLGLTGGHPQASCEAMVDLALQRGGHDNVTVQVIRLGHMHATDASRGQECKRSPVMSPPKKKNTTFRLLVGGSIAALILTLWVFAYLARGTVDKDGPNYLITTEPKAVVSVNSYGQSTSNTSVVEIGSSAELSRLAEFCVRKKYVVNQLYLLNILTGNDYYDLTHDVNNVRNSTVSAPADTLLPPIPTKSLPGGSKNLLTPSPPTPELKNREQPEIKSGPRPGNDKK